jgi:glycosyltransferase involved in cell wall biosynthesis
VKPTDESRPVLTSAPLVISWIRYHGRSEGLARALGAQAVWMPWATPGGPRWRTLLGWLRSTVRTVFAVLRGARGQLVVVMCPPVFALAAAVVAGRVRGAHVVADLHSGALNNDTWAWSHRLLSACLRHCRAVIVTNRELIEGFDTGHSLVVVAHDPPLPPPDGGTAPLLPPGPIVVFPASGAPDEPLAEVASAARLLQEEATVVITGRQPGVCQQPGLVLTGFVDDATYAALLRRADVVLALTRREATMQRAAYEALELGLPLVCSDTRVLRAAFGDAAIMTDSTPQHLAAAVREALLEEERLRTAAVSLRDSMRAEVHSVVRTLRDL